MSVSRATSVVQKTGDDVQSQLEYVEQSKAEHGYSRAVQRLYDLALRYVEDAEEACHRGRRTAWCMGLWEGPLFYACDTTPLSMTELGRLGSTDALAVAENFFQVPKETCSMVSFSLGEWYLRTQSPVRKIVIFAGICEPYNMAIELIKDYDYDIYRLGAVNKPLLDLGGREDNMRRYFTSELADLAVWLTGKPLDEGRMLFEIRRANRILTQIRTILDLRLTNPLYVKSLAAMYLLMGSAHYFGKPEEFEEVLALLIEEMRVAPYLPSPKGHVVPLTWIGARGQEFGVYQAIDDCGGAILGWVTPNQVAHPWREDLPPLESLTDQVLANLTTSSPVHTLKALDAVIQRTGSKGVFFYCVIGCSFGGVYLEMVRDYFHKKGIPGINLEGSFRVGPPSGQLLTRVRAFVEMLS